MENSLHLAELVCARLSHDLGGLLATLKGSLDLAAEHAAAADDGLDEALEAAGEAAGELARRVALLRAAWAGGGNGLDVRRVADLARGLPGAQRLRLDLSAIPGGTVFPPAMGRMVLNALLLASESLPRGGTVALGTGPDGAVLVTIAGSRAGWPTGLAACLADETAAWAALDGARRLLVPLAALTAVYLGIRVSLLLPSGRAVRGRPPPLLLSPA